MVISDLGNLRRALRTFDSNGRYSKRGLWSIANGGYDLWFEIYYDNIPVIDCVDGELQRCNSDDVSNADYLKLCNLIHSEYPDIAMPVEWGYRLTYLGETSSSYWEPGEVFDSTEYDDKYYSEDEAFSAALEQIKYSGPSRDKFDIDLFKVEG